MQQADYGKVFTNFIQPLSKLYNKNLNDEQMAAYVEDLAIYRAETLEISQKEIRRDSKYFPTIAQSIEACDKVQNIPKSTSQYSLGKAKYPWEIREDSKNKLVADYLAWFKNTSQICREAVAGKWDFELLNYVIAVAEIQAQMILNFPHIGWQSPVIFGYGTAITKEMHSSFFAEQRRIAAFGDIDVAIPTGRIENWKRNMAKEAA